MNNKEQHIWVPSVTLQSMCKNYKQKTVHIAAPICSHEQHTKTYRDGGSPEQLCTAVRPPHFSWTSISGNQISKEIRSSDGRWHTLSMAPWTRAL